MNLQLKRFRNQNDLTQKELAILIGASERQVGGWERGDIQLPLEDAWKIADQFHCTLDELAGRTPQYKREYADQRQEHMNKAYESMSEQGKEKAAGQVDDLAFKYKKHDMAASQEVAK